MPQYKAPGVYVEEVERGAKPIEGVGTSTPGFLGETERGPTEPRLVTSYADYQRLFGGVVDGRYLAQAVQGFFQNGGSRCYVGRVTPGNVETATGNLPAIGATVGDLRAEPKTLDFGLVAADQQPTKEVDVEPVAELGDETVTITNLAITGDRSGDFEVVTEVPSEGIAVEAGDPESIAVTFTHPSGESEEDGTTTILEVTVAGEADADDVPLTGEARGDPLESANNDGTFGYSTGKLDFGTVPIGEATARTVTFQNLGSTEVTLGDPGVSVTGAPFGMAQPDAYANQKVPPGGTVEVLVTATPESEGEPTGTLTLEDDSGNPTNVNLEVDGIFTDEVLAEEGGTASNDGTLATATGPQAFGTFVVGNTRKFLLHNRGEADVTLNNVNWSGEGDAFRLREADAIDDGGLTIPGGSSVELTVHAAQATESTAKANLTLGFSYQSGAQTGTVVVVIKADVVESLIELAGVGPGNWGAGVAVTVADASLYDPSANDLFQVAVRYWRDPADRAVARTVLADPGRSLDEAPDPDVEELYDNLSPIAASSDHYGTTLSGNSTLVDVVDENSRDDGPRPANGTVWLDADFPNEAVEAGDYDGDAVDPDDRTGFAAFEQVDEITMVCVPDEHEYSSGLSGKVVTHCTGMGDRVAILNSPPSPDPPGALQPTERSDFAAFYYPWLTVGHPETGRDQDVPPGGHVAGIYARSDQEQGVHKAPANEQVRGIRGLQKTVSKGDQASLNPRGVNCIRTFRGRGTRVWGARTTSSDPAWKYVNVRRLFLFVEESIDEGTQWVVFEPNDEQLWARVRQTIRNFLTSVWQDGALMGTTPEQAFYVKCDRSTMTQNDIDNGRLICEIGIAPVKPAEFVIFRISQKTAGAE
ncbi:phage tail sheath C-terminal domain-containing protein [Halobellus litoreus]|uniref:Phage tail sheath C-terminal domain-containing protein n=1 Tax=Halobellus litoreus TaxID=755310 RepID=A0ABD6DXU1_9EURY|nr:phage tail sheath C-terminal domain-containing protein [Halobellus litoreus]